MSLTEENFSSIIFRNAIPAPTCTGWGSNPFLLYPRAMPGSIRIDLSSVLKRQHSPLAPRVSELNISTFFLRLSFRVSELEIVQHLPLTGLILLIPELDNRTGNHYKMTSEYDLKGGQTPRRLPPCYLNFFHSC